MSDMSIQIGGDEIIAGLDQTLPMDKTQKQILQRVDDVMQHSIEMNDPDIAATAIVSLLGVSRISGLALAKFIYTFKFQWKNFNRRDTFEDYLEDRIGRGRTTIKRYYNVWEMLVEGDIPKEYNDKLKLHPMKCLVPISNLLNQGYEVPSNKWMQLANAPDVATVNKICREIKNKEPRRGSLSIELERDGTIVAWKDGEKFTVGVLNVNSEQKEVQQAIEKIVADGRVLVK